MATVNEPVHACKLVNKIEQTDTKLDPMYRDPNHITGYALAVKLDGHNSHLLVDTGASGIYIGRKFAEKAGLTRISENKFVGVGDKGRRVDTSHLPVTFELESWSSRIVSCMSLTGRPWRTKTV